MRIKLPRIFSCPQPDNAISGYNQGALSLRQAVDMGRTRLLMMAAMFGMAFIVICGRLVQVTLLTHGESYAANDVAPTTPPPLGRADIVDRNGVLLATSLISASLYADGAQIIDAEDAARKLATVLPVSKAELLKKLTPDKRFVWLWRKLTPRQQYAINKLGIPGVYFQREDQRVYPHGALAAHIVGFADVDNRGLSGIEQSFDDKLRRTDKPVQLSVDIRLQHILHAELESVRTEFSAVGAAGIIMDARTGEILSMVSLPDFNPNDPNQGSPENRFNRTTLGVYEMGSTFKIFNTALALEAGTTSLSGGYDATNPIKIARFTISDSHAKKRWLSVPEIFMYSSNIGSAKMALDVGGEKQRAFLDKLGLLKPVSFELPELGRPHIPNPWRPISTMTVAFGHGMSVSPLHLVSGVAGIINHGTMHKPTLMKQDPATAEPGTQVVSEKTSLAVRRLMRLVVEQGTGKAAEADGYLVGGKTGTAEKNQGGVYHHKALLSSFIGAFPMNDPRYVVLVMVDEPVGNSKTYGYATGGWVAAPAVGRIVNRIAPMLGVQPIDETTPEIQKEMFVEVSGHPQSAHLTKAKAEAGIMRLDH